MLAICIPVFNADVTALVQELDKQAKEQEVPVEIICIDDVSELHYKITNKPICEKLGQYIELPKNVGRSRIRNLFLKHTQQPWLLFLDCDSTIIRKDFLKKYIASTSIAKVICGGREYTNVRPAYNQILRWKYGIQLESKGPDKRNQEPYKSLLSNNFLISRDTFAAHLFDESLTDYGHEDTLFGFSLMKNKIAVMHIDNAILNGDAESNELFLKKTEIALNNLYKIILSHTNQIELIQHIKLLKVHQRLCNNKLIMPVVFLYSLLKPMLKIMLVKGYVDLRIFSFYKLGYYHQLVKQKGNQN